MVSIKGLDKAAVLAALYNRANTGTEHFLQYDPTPMTVGRAREVLSERTIIKFFRWRIEMVRVERRNFGYIAGRVMGVNLTSDESFDASIYDSPGHNGPGAAEEVIRILRETGDVNPSSIQEAHRLGECAALKRQIEDDL